MLKCADPLITQHKWASIRLTMAVGRSAPGKSATRADSAKQQAGNAT